MKDVKKFNLDRVDICLNNAINSEEFRLNISKAFEADNNNDGVICEWIKKVRNFDGQKNRIANSKNVHRSTRPAQGPATRKSSGIIGALIHKKYIYCRLISPVKFSQFTHENELNH